MIYFDEMCNKYGFCDGEAQPYGCYKLRSLYVTVINETAAALESDVRWIEFNRGGMHNDCMALLVTREQFNEHGQGPHDNVPWLEGEADIDDAMVEALDVARDLNPDQYVEVGVKVDILRALYDARIYLEEMEDDDE